MGSLTRHDATDFINWVHKKNTSFNEEDLGRGLGLGGLLLAENNFVDKDKFLPIYVKAIKGKNETNRAKMPMFFSDSIFSLYTSTV